MSPKKYEPLHQVVVTVSAEAPVSGTVDINYMVTEAGWIPSHDLRSTSPSEPVQLTYSAVVYQNTGEDWDDVNLKLSTSNRIEVILNHNYLPGILHITPDFGRSLFREWHGQRVLQI
ncbi:MAG: DUF4139 domain-containing protein [Bacteroidetes bacterium]|nr:DUF4139 domain-containing protein [Bacteroidota bacterium]